MSGRNIAYAFFFLGCCIWEPSMREINFRKYLVFWWSNECMDLLILRYVLLQVDMALSANLGILSELVELLEHDQLNCMVLHSCILIGF